MTAEVTALKRATFRYIEAELYDYHKTKADLMALRAEIIEAAPRRDDKVRTRGQSYRGDPTASRAARLVTNRRLTKMAETIAAIEKVNRLLPPEKRRLIELKYWDGTLSNRRVAEALHVSDATFYRWRQEIITAVAIELGLMDAVDDKVG